MRFHLIRRSEHFIQKYRFELHLTLIFKQTICDLLMTLLSITITHGPNFRQGLGYISRDRGFTTLLRYPIWNQVNLSDSIEDLRSKLRAKAVSDDQWSTFVKVQFYPTSTPESVSHRGECWRSSYLCGRFDVRRLSGRLGFLISIVKLFLTVRCDWRKRDWVERRSCSQQASHCPFLYLFDCFFIYQSDADDAHVTKKIRLGSQKVVLEVSFGGWP